MKKHFHVANNHLLPIGVDTKPAEADDAEVDKDVDENRWVNVAEVEDDEDYEADDPDDEEGGDPDEGGVDEVVVGGADADDEEGAGGERDGGQDEAEDALPNVNFSANLPLFPGGLPLPGAIWDQKIHHVIGVTCVWP